MLFLLVSLFFSCIDDGKKKQDPAQVKNNESGELSNSPRHHEWVTLSHGEREFQAFVVYPENKEKAKPVIVIHENRGLND